MGFFVDVPQPLNIVVGIDLRGRQAAVPKQLFYGIQFSPISSEVGGKTVAQYMWAFLVCSGNQREIFLYDIIKLTGRWGLLFWGKQEVGKDRIRKKSSLFLGIFPDLFC